ncbi:MAG: FtsX-like permease family protein [Bacteroidota bacterium]
MVPDLLHNLKISLRMLARSKVNTAINLSGLVLGLTISFILLIFAINEVSYNRCFDNADRIFRVIHKDTTGLKVATGSFSFKNSLTGYFHSVEKTARIVNLNYIIGKVSIKWNAVYQDVPGFFCSDPELPDILQLKITRGLTKNFLTKPYQVIISDHAARQLQAAGSPIGKSLKIKINGQAYQLIVAAVYRDLPWNSTFQADFIANIGFYKEVLRQAYGDPAAELSSVNDYETVVLLDKKARLNDIEAGMAAFTRDMKLETGSIVLQNSKDIHLDSGEIQNDFIAKGSKENLVIYLSLSFFILLLASINYSMLNTARSALRFKEIGVRKVLGATIGNLRNQLLTESVILSSCALPLSFLLLGLIEPVIEQLFGYRIHLDSTNIYLYIGITSFISLAIGLISGLYVAVYLSSLDPVTALKSNYIIYKKISFSKLFTVFQIFITLMLFIGLINVYLQIRLCLVREHGMNKQNLLVVSINPDEKNVYRVMKEDLSRCDFVTSVSGSSIQVPANDSKKAKFMVPWKNNEKVDFEMMSVDYDFFRTLGAKIISGRDFLRGDTSGAIPAVINEEAANRIGFKLSGNNQIGKYKIIGIVNDFNIHSLHQKISPMLLKLQPWACKTILARYNAGSEQDLLAVINKSWSRFATELPLEYKFYDQQLNVLYVREQNFGRIVGSFTILAFIITGMGLFGLSILIVERRMKEMSVRKVYGASPGSIVYLIQKEFIIYMIIAATAAIPLAWYLVSLWLDRFYYRIGMHWFTFLFSVIIVGFFISMILFVKTLRILRENPANALKYE